MTEPPADPPETPDPDPAAELSRAKAVARRDAILRAGGMLIAVAAVAALTRWAMGGRPAHTSWAIQLLLGAATVAGICWGAWQRYRLWTLPVRRLGDVAERVRKGEVPLDELSTVDGVPGILVPVVRDLLVDLKTRRAEIAQLEKEMNQRVANRTDALERMLGTLRERASRDPLTGLLNRRMLDEMLPRLVRERNLDHRPLTVLMIDVDYFKVLNDTLGHAAGDDLLRAIGQIIRSTVRPSDAGFRTGGDEFVVVMDDADAVAGRSLADRLISLVDALGKTLRVAKKPRLSIGVAVLSEAPGRTPEALLALADKVLYEVKGARKRAA
ncbi:MAG TPA: GGDEF domain-containing protein [Humisphaera sp.]